METKLVKKWMGIDVASEKLDIFFNGKHKIVSNDPQGFTTIEDLVNAYSNIGVLVEETGHYDNKLLNHLFIAGIEVYRVRAIDAYLLSLAFGKKNKTDKADAKFLAENGDNLQKTLFIPDELAIKRSKELSSNQDFYIKQKTAITNRIKSIELLDNPDEIMLEELRELEKNLDEKIKKTQKREEEILREAFPDTLKLVLSVPGIGIKTACLMIRTSEGFQRLKTPKEFVSFVGYNPRLYQSGKNQNPSGRITKQGNGKSRATLFLASLSAARSNLACKAKYERLVSAGKAKKKALVAVIDKMIHQVYAIVKSGIAYNSEYCSKKTA